MAAYVGSQADYPSNLTYNSIRIQLTFELRTLEFGFEWRLGERFSFQRYKISITKHNVPYFVCFKSHNGGRGV